MEGRWSSNWGKSNSPTFGRKWRPSTDMNCALMVMERLPTDLWPEVGRMDDGRWYCEIVGRGDTPPEVSPGPLAKVVSDTAPLAVCLAVLQVLTSCGTH